MAEPLSMAPALIAGMLLGAFFFGGLWWTVRIGVAANHPALWFSGSMVLRTCIVLLGFHFTLGDDWERLLAGLLGFIVARLIMLRLTRVAEQAGGSAQEAGHAP